MENQKICQLYVYLSTFFLSIYFALLLLHVWRTFTGHIIRLTYLPVCELYAVILSILHQTN